MVVIISPFVLNTAAAESVSRLPAEGWAAVLFLGIFCSGVGYVLWAYSLKEMGSSKAGVFLYLEPFVTVFTAWIILGETITPVIILSGLIITSGVVLVNLNRTRS
jgi:drug/metabolite transporter (DMT)-like permease